MLQVLKMASGVEGNVFGMKWDEVVEMESNKVFEMKPEETFEEKCVSKVKCKDLERKDPEQEQIRGRDCKKNKGCDEYNGPRQISIENDGNDVTAKNKNEVFSAKVRSDISNVNNTNNISGVNNAKGWSNISNMNSIV